MLEITLSAKKHYLFLWWWSWGAGGWGYLAGWAKIPTWKLWPPYGLMVLLMRRSRMDWYRKVALAEMQTLNLKKSKTNSYLTFCQVYFKGLFGYSFFCWASFVVLLICFFQLICFLLWWFCCCCVFCCGASLGKTGGIICLRPCSPSNPSLHNSQTVC